MRVMSDSEMTDNAGIDEDVVLGYLPSGKADATALKMGPGGRVRSGTVLYAGASIGANLETGHHTVIRERNTIGDDVCIWSNTVIDYGCTIGNRVKIHCNVYIPQFTTIADDVFIAPGCTFANDVYPGCPDSKTTMRGPRIGRGVQIGVNVTILPRVTIGEYSLIGSGSVVTNDIAPRSVVWGNPARVQKHIDDLNCCSGDPACVYSRHSKQASE